MIWFSNYLMQYQVQIVQKVKKCQVSFKKHYTNIVSMQLYRNHVFDPLVNSELVKKMGEHILLNVQYICGIIYYAVSSFSVCVMLFIYLPN